MTTTPAVMVGLGIGDALGMPFEKRRDQMHPGLETWDGTYQYGERLKLPSGYGTDDTDDGDER